jgi:predicted RNA-binding Zn-ribbon protein involved in translation (DUF1610 family)
MMKRDRQASCSTCGEFIREGDQVYVADDEGQPIYVDDEMQFECPGCDTARVEATLRDRHRAECRVCGSA